MSSRLWRIGLIVATLAVGIALGGVLGGGLSSSTPSAALPIGPDVGDIRVGAADAGPHDKVDGVGVGFTRSEEGAVAAATNLILTLEQAGSTDRGNAVRAYEILAAEGSKDFLAAEMATAWDALHGTIAANGPVSSTLFLRTVPVGHQVARYSQDRATVEIWTLTIVAAAGMNEPIATWETATVEVVWEDEDWKVWSAVSDQGPSPAWATSAVTPIEPFLTNVEVLEGYRYVSG
ncbi:MAG: hypothetical protein GY724_06240 [Actinomycetia bacterium]|nr:hypothetical protein [Actinomycetes bacterium]MCP5034015.1 hypothetical protein [Actinomycetes bacterium]